MSSLCALGVSTAILCGLWSCVSGFVGLLGWAGFAGCTTYFACGEKGFSGIKKTICCNLAGVLCGITIIYLGDWIPALNISGVWCALITFVMCIISKYKIVNYCPGIFMGCFTTFAANGEWKLLIPSLLIGAVLGFACDMFGGYLYKIFGKKDEKIFKTDKCRFDKGKINI